MANSLLTINYASIFDVQNTPDIIAAAGGDIQRDDLTVSPLNVARYFLYDRVKGREQNFGLNDSAHLQYPGGFITVGDKVNTKHSDFTVNRTLTIYNSSFFNRGFSVRDADNQNTTRITNVRRIGIENIRRLTSTDLDHDIITVSDFKAFSYRPGMIMLWSGTYQDLLQNLPYWRLCAPPDSGTLNVPNLRDRFIMGGSYGNYQPTDNENRNFGSVVSLGSMGGSNKVKLDATQLRNHIHDNRLTLKGSKTSLQSTGTFGFITGGGGVTRSGTNSHASGGITTVNSISRNAFNYTALGLTRQAIQFGTQREDKRGGRSGGADNSCDVHENRPPFYALAYIMYVGILR